MATKWVDLSAEELLEHALQRREGVISANGAITVNTLPRTGRSPKDRFIVKDANTESQVAWGAINQPFSPEKFETLWNKALAYIENRDQFISHLRVGADDQYTVNVNVITELAWHNLFTRNLFIREPSKHAKQEWTMLAVPTMKTDPQIDGTNSDATVILDFTHHRILVCGTHYAGEMKKAMFTVLNYLLPTVDVLPMHCSANVGQQGDSALFFGLSGTGKTTLSADPNRYLVGDDEHGWSNHGIFKCIDLSKEKEPVIWDAIKRGAVMENVVLDEKTQLPDYSDTRHTQNTRAAYPLEHIALRVPENKAGQPQAVVFLTCDLYGVLPPVALLTKEQAAYHFLSGYTALVGSTEVGQTEAIKQTFSTCFGAPFFPRSPAVYANLLMKRLDETGAQVYLVNTGWTGGAYGEGGKRFSIPTTRAVINAILAGELRDAALETLPGFNLRVPTQLSGVDALLLNPRNTWQDKAAFDEKLRLLMHSFHANFDKFADVDKAIKNAGPNE